MISLLLILLVNINSCEGQSAFPLMDSIRTSMSEGNVLLAKKQLSSLPKNSTLSSAEDLSLAIEVAIANADWKNANAYLLQRKRFNTTDSLYTTFKEGEINFYLGNFVLAKKLYWEVFTSLRRQGKEQDPLYELSLFRLGEFFFETGSFDISEKIYLTDLKSSIEIFGKDKFQYARAMDKLGVLTSLKSEYDNASVYHDIAEKIIIDQLGARHPEHARNMVYIGKLLLEKGEYTVAETFFRQAAALYKTTLPTYHPYQLELNMAYADLFIYLHNYGNAVELLEKTITLYESYYSHSHPIIASASYKIASIYIENGYISQAKAHLDTAQSISNATTSWKHPDNLYTRSTLADYMLANGNINGADSLYSLLTDSVPQALNEKNRLITGITSLQAQMYYKIGKYEDAISLYQRINEMQKEILQEKHPEYIQSIRDQALIFWAMGREKKASRYFQTTADNYIFQFNKVFAFQSEKEKNLYYRNVKSFFDKYNAFIMANPSPKLIGEMYDNQLSTKAILFTSTSDVRKKVFESGDVKLQTKYGRWISNKEKLAKLYKLQSEGYSIKQRTIDSMETLTNTLEKDIQLSIELKQSKEGVEKKVASWKDIQKRLGENEAAIELIRIQDFKPDSGGINSDKVLYAALIITKETKKSPELVVLRNGKDLEKRYILYYRNAIHFQIEDTISYQNFWQPIAESPSMKGKSKVFLSVDGVYNQLSLNTFYHGATSKYLVEEYDFHLVTNTKDIIALKAKTSDQTTVPENTVLFGFPDYYHQPLVTSKKNTTKKATTQKTTESTRDARSMFRGGHITELPGTKAEVNAINKILHTNGNNQTALMTGKNASEDSLKAVMHAGILHIASHGFFLEPSRNKNKTSEDEVEILNELNDNPLLLCGIMLSGAGHAYSEEVLDAEIKALYKGENMEDGILTAYEAMNLNLQDLELVVLSCCETGLGEVKNGEGVYGFQRALQTAGAKAIIMSLWKVNDNATQKLMVYFYEEWMKTSNKRLSFAKAQEKLRLEFKDPIYWGAFIMIGE